MPPYAALGQAGKLDGGMMGWGGCADGRGYQAPADGIINGSGDCSASHNSDPGQPCARWDSIRKERDRRRPEQAKGRNLANCAA